MKPRTVFLAVIALLISIGFCTLVALQTHSDDRKNIAIEVGPFSDETPSQNAATGESDMLFSEDRGDGSTSQDVPSENCPISIPVSEFLGMRANDLGRGWSYTTCSEIDALVPAILEQMQGSGYELVCATALDLFGEAWGCVAKSESHSAVVLVHIAPKTIALSSEDQAVLRVSVVELGVGQ